MALTLVSQYLWLCDISWFGFGKSACSVTVEDGLLIVDALCTCDIDIS